MKRKPNNELPNFPDHVELAHYDTNQRSLRFAGNKLIEALPSSVDEVELMKMLTYLPDFEPESRMLAAHERMHELIGLTNIMVPLAAHIQLARTIDSLMRSGYVGRRPLSRDHVAIYHRINEGAAEKKPFRQAADTVKPQLSTALIGVSGMGKTTTVKRCLAHLPTVIYHPDFDLYQIPYLHFEMPSDGKSEKALATGIIERIDKLLPHFNYYEEFVGKSRASGQVMLRQAARLMNKHCVGLLIPDEIQNMSNTRKEDQVVMTELTSLCNVSEVPILFIGTNKAEKILGLDFRQARRSLGYGLGDWGPLPRWDLAADADGRTALVEGEWVELMTSLWRYQWVQKPVKLDESLLAVFYECTQGVIDLAIKLFIVAQGRAILDGSEQLSEQLIRDVYKTEMRLIHPMVDALRDNDIDALMKFEDVRPLSTKDLLNDLSRRYRGQRSPAASTRPGIADFELRLTRAAQELGLSTEDAAALARQINEEGTAKDMFDAMRQLAKKVAPQKRVAATKASKRKAAEAPAPVDFSDRPLDYRRAIAESTRAGTAVVEQLVNLGMAPDVEDLLCLA